MTPVTPINANTDTLVCSTAIHKQFASSTSCEQAKLRKNEQQNKSNIRHRQLLQMYLLVPKWSARLALLVATDVRRARWYLEAAAEAAGTAAAVILSPRLGKGSAAILLNPLICKLPAYRAFGRAAARRLMLLPPSRGTLTLDISGASFEQRAGRLGAQLATRQSRAMRAQMAWTCSSVRMPLSSTHSSRVCWSKMRLLTVAARHPTNDDTQAEGKSVVIKTRRHVISEDIVEETVRPSQIDTSVGLSQNTVNALLDSPSGSELELADAAVMAAFDLSPCDIRLNASHRDTAVSLHRISEGSGIESGSECDGVEEEDVSGWDYDDDDAIFNKAAEEMDEASSHRFKLGPTVKQIRCRLKAKPGYQTHEILPVIRLLIARMLCLQRRRFAAHWAIVEDGAVPAGGFGRFMGRNRCQDLWRDLHFVDNEAAHNRDTLWKLHPVVDRVQQRFLVGWSLPTVFSFDEGALTATSKHNATRMFMPDKLYRYGSKIFMMCDSKTAFDSYAGKRNDDDAGDRPFDLNTGAATVARNLLIVLTANSRHKWHAVVEGQADQSNYGSMSHCCERLPARDGWSRCALSTPPQTYLLQSSTKFKKYYKSLFLGIVDLALVSAYISHKEAANIMGTPVMKRAEWYGVLQNQLLQPKPKDFANVAITPAPSTQSASATPYSFATTLFCDRCSIHDAKCWLCNKIRREYKSVAKTCFDIWHDDFDADQQIPANLGKRIVLRRPDQVVDKRKKTRRELRLHDGADGDDETD
ncbi:unnamed protein product [Phytophthora fragariaefolia]|uniref:Unnamed protein product n=1 Tax=Phytophthora fragariaefolia TaxID=1490495 RepID=A0A9W6TYC6_9STRA|nr:unnamed protein product [Phytophthora fragariaefolia]